MDVSAPSAAGRSAERHFKAFRRRWRRKMAPTLVAAAAGTSVAALLAATLLPTLASFSAGLIAGAGLALLLWAWDEPPEVIAKWGRGAAGERATARALSRLGRAWYVRHDLEGRYGNVDHVAVGPGGVFLLDSKKLSGRAEVVEGLLSVRFAGSPIDDYTCTGLPRALQARARWLRERLKERLGWIVDVVPVVVLVGAYPQGRVEAREIAYIGVEDLAAWLDEQPLRVAARDVEAIARLVVELPAAGDLSR